MSYLRAVWTTAASVGSSPHGLILHQAIEQLRGQPLKLLGALGVGDAGVEVVEDVVGAPGEPVQRVHRGPLLGRQQPGGQEERPAVRGR